MDRVDLYLQWNINEKAYVNTPEEQERLNKFVALYSIAEAEKQRCEFANNENIAKWRKAYYGTLNALNKDGTESKRQSRQLRKLIYEFIESKIDNSIPMPRMMPKYKQDMPLVEVTDDFLKYEIDNIFTKYLNDRSERSTYVDGTSWYKVWWDNTDNSQETSGNVKIDVCLADQIVPQPGVLDWRKLQYIFELQQVSIATLYDLYGRVITPIAANTSQPATPNQQSDLSTITVVTCYYINDKGIVGRFMWSKNTLQVICDEESWQIRRVRTCKHCGNVQPRGEDCMVCGYKSWKYEQAKTEYLEEDLVEVYNPYDVGETDDIAQQDQEAVSPFLTKGTEIPFYELRQLPFVPRPAVSSVEYLYGVSEVSILLEMQDVANKFLTKMTDKVLKSGAIITKPKQLKINDTDDTFKILNVRTYEEAQQVQLKQISADISQDILGANLLYDSAKASSGVTDSFQGQKDTTATSGKAKEFAAMQTAGRIESLRVMKAAAFAGVYELVLKYLLAFSNEPRKFVKVLPNGEAKQEEWNKYMFLDKDKFGQIYYRDDFKFSTDPAATLSTNRVAMWQETSQQFLQGTFGTPTDPRVLELYWTIMQQHQYPLADDVLAGIKNNSQHLPPEIEQMLMQNQEILQQAIQLAQEQGIIEGQENRGGARPNSGPDGNGFTKAANTERTNERNRAINREPAQAVQAGTSGGGLNG